MHPDVAFVVNKLSQFMNHPTNDHWKAVNCILCFMYSQMLTAPETMMIIPPPMPISCILDKIQSTWSSKKQHTIACSLTEAEYHSVATTAAKLSCVCKLLTELGVVVPQVPVIFYDNIGANHLCSYHVFHLRMKHVTLDYCFVEIKYKVVLSMLPMSRPMINYPTHLPSLFHENALSNSRPRLDSPPKIPSCGCILENVSNCNYFL